ncbi:MAG: hypothetical protein KDC38_13265 [Planctomycetes bacterium]|nr:hypothetical protein [Planctomycetota bacterium]
MLRALCWLGVVLVWVVSCDKSDSHDHEHEHAHPDPQHGGTLLEVGHEVAHVELVHDVAAGKVLLYVTGSDGKKALSIDPPTIKLTTDSGPQVIATTAVGGAGGKASEFEAMHDALKSDPLEGRLSLSIDGKAYNPELEHDHDH